MRLLTVAHATLRPFQFTRPLKSNECNCIISPKPLPYHMNNTPKTHTHTHTCTNFVLICTNFPCDMFLLHRIHVECLHPCFITFNFWFKSATKVIYLTLPLPFLLFLLFFLMVMTTKSKHIITLISRKYNILLLLIIPSILPHGHDNQTQTHRYPY